MANEKTPRQKPASGTPKAAKTTDTTNTTPQQAAAKPASTAKKGGTKGNRSRVGGTAIPGAKSTAPRETPTGNNSAQQQADSYNRDMRRRMQHLGTGPQGDNQKVNTIQEKRRKRIERRKQRIEQERERLRRSTPGGKITLGRRNLYFIIGVVALVVLIIVIFVVLRATNVIHY